MSPTYLESNRSQIKFVHKTTDRYRLFSLKKARKDTLFDDTNKEKRNKDKRHDQREEEA